MGGILEKVRRFREKDCLGKDWINYGEIENFIRKSESRRGKT